jgi:hypothetical protein
MVTMVAMVEIVTSTGLRYYPAVLERETDDAADCQTPWKGMTYWEFVSRISEHFSENMSSFGNVSEIWNHALWG